MIKKKGLIFISLLICLFLSMSLVSASDQTDNLTLSANDNMDILQATNDNINILESTTQEVIGEGEPGTFTDLNTKINVESLSETTILLDKDYIYSDGDDAFIGGIDISRDYITIDGQGHIINGSNIARIFNVGYDHASSPVNNVVLKNITFVNAFNPYDVADSNQKAYAAIQFTGSGSIEDCNFYYNNASCAPAIAWGYGTQCTIINCNFENNTAFSSGGIVRYRNGMTYSFITNSTFKNNRAFSYGGAVHWDINQNSHNNTIYNCDFINNTANRGAGAVFLSATDDVINMSRFINNSAGLGGAIYWQGHNGKIINTNFTTNNATEGGSIYWTGGNGLVNNCSFDRNNATYRGGAVLLANSINSIFSNCTFDDNIAGTNGGAIDWQQGSSNGRLINSTFNNNIAERSGGAVFWYGHNGTVMYCNFTGNRALGRNNATDVHGIVTYGGDGGAIIWTGALGLVDHCIFISNSAENATAGHGRGGAVYLQAGEETCTNTTFSYCTFEDNWAATNGGAIDWNEGADDGNILYSNFTHNTANSNGGAVFWSGHNGEIHHSNFTRNTAEGLITDLHNNVGDGGAIIWSGLNGTVTDCRFVENNASQRGGAVYLQNCTHGNCTNTTFSHVFFKKNFAGTNGGAIDWHEGAEDGHVLYAVFEENTAKRSGGAIYWNGKNGEIKHSTFTGNKALGNATASDAFGNITTGGDGGAVIWIGSEGSVDDCRFINNNASKRGGAVYLQGTSQANCTDTNFTNSIFTNNYAGTNGGAIDWNKGAHNGMVDNVTFISNTAKRSGGAIYWNGHNGTIKNSKFLFNNALGNASAKSVNGSLTNGGDGGAIIWSGALGFVDNVTCINNTAAKRGGAVFLQGSESEPCENTTFKNSKFINNTAGTNGGAIDWSEGSHNGIVNNVTFINNTANKDGGAIFWNGYNGTVKNSQFINNTAGDDGGAMYWEGNVGKIDNITAIQNKGLSYGNSSSRGGAICLTGQLTVITNSKFIACSVTSSDNITKIQGGALFITGNNVNITSTTFEACNANLSGGAVHIIGNISLIDNCTFKHSSAINGSAVYMEGLNSTIQKSKMIENKASEDGGALYVVGNGAKLLDTQFARNTAGDDGGAIYWQGSNGLIKNITCDQSNAISEDNHNSKGGVICLTGSNVTVTESKFNRSLAVVDGGVIFFTGNNVNITLCSFSYSNVSGNGGSIYALGDYALIKDCEFDRSNALNGGMIFIEGHDVTIDNVTSIRNFARNDGGAIYVSGNSAKIKNSNLTDTNATNYGGALYIAGNLTTIDYSNFTRCVADNRDGGALFIAGLNSSISHSRFKQNKVNQANGHGGSINVQGNYTNITLCMFDQCNGFDGGVIFINGSHVTIDGYSCNRSLATNNGGAIYVLGNNAIIKNFNISNTNATNHGGAIYVAGNSSTIQNSNFTRCISYSGNGGALYVAGFNTTISNSKFYQNKVAGDTATGGSIDIHGDSANITNCEFMFCSAYEGGVIFVEGDYVNVDTFTSKFSSSTNGGAIYVKGDNATISNGDIMFSNATISGGAMYITGVNTTVSYSNFTLSFSNGTTVFMSQHDGGGAIYVEGDNAIIKYSIFKNCTAERDGGAILLVRSDYANLTGNTFTNNFANISGGAVAFSNDAVNGTVDLCNFTNNSARGDGGAIYWYGSSYGKLFNSNFTNNTAGIFDGNGGAVYWGNSNYGHIYNCRFISNQVLVPYYDINGQGGAVYWYGENGTIENSYFADNTALTNIGRRGGGAIAFLWSGKEGAKNTTIINSVFERNYSPHGGVICSELCNILTIIDSHFNNNSASQGACIFLENAVDVKILSSTFDSNNAVEHGGVVYFNKDGNDNILFDNCNFTNNSARLGGALRMNGASNFNVTNSLFVNDNAVHASQEGTGGAISCDHLISNFNLINSTFINCTTTTRNGDGGAVYLLISNSKLENLTFINCSANRNGGSIYLNTVTNTLFKNITIYNSSATNGGSVYILKNTPIFANATIFNSKSTGSGGSIHIDGSSSQNNPTLLANISIDGSYNTGNYGGALYVNGYAKVTNLTATNGYSKQGGAIYWNGLSGILDGANISNFKATSWSGGSICWNNNLGKIYNVNISNSTAPNYGGAVYLTNKNNIEIVNMTINNASCTRSTSRGGAIYLESSSYCSFVNLTINNTSAASGGAICLYPSSYCSFVNLTINNTSAVSGGAIYIYGNNLDTQGINNKFTNFNITNSKASSNGGAIYICGENNNVAYASNNTFANFTIKNSSAANGGAAYIYSRQAKNAQNVSFINGTIEKCDAKTNGGAIYWSADGGNIYNVTFLNNTASLGGAIYVEKYSLTIDKSYFNRNIATSGSAIYTTVDLTIKNTELFLNRANSDKLLIAIDSSDLSQYKVTITFTGMDNLLNAIRAIGNINVLVDNVSYWSAYGQNNTGSRTLTQTDQSFLEAGQNITVEIYDSNNKKIYFGNDVLTDLYGSIVITVPSVSSANTLSSSRRGLLGATQEVDGISVKAFLTNEDYYTFIEKSIGKDLSHITAIADNIDYHENTTIRVNVTPGATGKVSVYINETFYDNITLSNSEGSLVNVSYIKWDKYLPAGNYTLFAQYWGDDSYLPSNITSTFEVRKITPDVIIDIDDKGYDLYITLTVKSDDLLDSTGNVTLEVDGRTINVTIVNGTGFVIVRDITEGIYTINANYSGDSNYYANNNSTELKMNKKLPSSIELEVHDIMINETESINVTVNVNATGNVTIYVNGKPYSVALNESKAQLNVTGLPKGTNYVLVIYDGDKYLTGDRVEDTFLVSKYEPTVIVNATNITAGSVEKLNITLPEDAEGIIKVDINGSKYYGEIENGEVIINATDLKVGIYNVTVYFFEDGKYLSCTNSTLFKVSQATTTVNVYVDNITYGNQTIVKVVLPSDANGTISININDTYKLENVELVNGTYTWIVPGILASDNYTASVIYSGDEKYVADTNSTDFEVYQATPVITIEAVVVDANSNATVIVHITPGTTGDINITVNGKNYSGPIEDGIARITIDMLDVDTYDIVAN
ncbi:MAG: Ig-like domain repeat protein, partial [Methanobrevibacter sp.]|nr:Ig-like domain repeat protein [Methanobrevibacter sp.]